MARLSPMPFSGSGTLDIRLQKGEKVRVDMLTPDGRYVQTVFEEYLPSGHRKVPVYLSHFEPGLLFIKNTGRHKN